MQIFLSTFTGPVTSFGYGCATHVACLGQEYLGGAHPSPGLQVVWIQSFLSRPVVILKLKGPVSFSFTLSWEKNSCIHIFTKDIWAIWNANSPIQGLNSVRRIYSLQRQPLRHELFFKFFFFFFFNLTGVGKSTDFTHMIFAKKREDRKKKKRSKTRITV